MSTTMMKRALAALAVAATLPSTAPAVAQTTRADEGAGSTTLVESGYAPVDGLELYYEVHGSGEPLILLHGGIAASEVFGANLPKLAEGRRVVAVHLQGHGRTRDIDRPLRYELMADDVAALIAHLGLGKADVLGYSLGAGVALQTAIRHPRVVDRLVLVSAPPPTPDGWYPEVRAAFEEMAANAPVLASNVERSPLARLHPDVDWEVLFTRIGELESRDYDWTAGIASITAPTMLVYADADAVRPDPIVEFYELLGGGRRDAGLDGSGRPIARLAIVPGTTHYDILTTTAVARFAAAFLDAPLPGAK